MKNSFYQENNLKQSILLAPNTHINSQNAYSSLKNSMLDFEHSQPSTLRGEKPLQESIVIQNYGDEPKDFQIEIERRYQKSNLSKSYSFPRHTVTKETNEDSCNSPVSSSSSSSLNSLKQVTSYNLHAQNYKAESLYDVYSTSSNQTGDTHSTKNKSRNKSKTRKKEKIVLTEDINYIQDENTPVYNKYASNNLSNKASSSSLKLVQLIGMQINRNKESYTIQNPAPNVIQKEPAKKNKAVSPYRYSCPKQKVYLANPHNNQRNSAKNNLRNSAAFDNTRKKEIEEKSANQTEKSEYYIRKTWERKKSPGLSEYKKAQQISGLQSPQFRNDTISLKKILGNKDLNSNSGLLSGFGSPQCRNIQRTMLDSKLMRSISPKSNTSTSNANESSLRGFTNDSLRPSSRAGGTLYEKTKRNVMDQSRILNTSGSLAGKRYNKGNNLSIFESSLYLFERPSQLLSTKRITANMCRSPTTASTKALNSSNYTSPKNYPRNREELKAEDISKALKTSNSKSRLTYHETVSSPQKVENRNSTTSLLHPYSITRYLTTNNTCSKERKTKNNTSKEHKSLIKSVVQAEPRTKGAPQNLAQKYSLFMSEPAVKELKEKSFSALTPTPKVTVFKNLLQNKIYNKTKK